MPKQPPHAYRENLAFERLMLLIATFLKYPGVGSPDLIDSGNNQNHDAMSAVQGKLRQLAMELGLEWPETYPAVPTLRKDLETLRRYGILDRRMYRWGYYLGTGVFSLGELKVAFNALASQAQYQRDPQIRRIHESLSLKLRGLDSELKGEISYPVRQYLNRTIVHTDPEEMAAKGENRDTLFHQLPLLETAIVQGKAITVSRSQNFYGSNHTGRLQVFPLQLIYHDIAWYLLYEYCDNGHLAIGRLNRFNNYCQPLNIPERGLDPQKQSLDRAYQLLENGWGLNLGDVQSQADELEGKLPLIQVSVRFFPPISAFILEGERRHPKQKIDSGPIDPHTRKPSYVKYTVNLPSRSLEEFIIWVYRYMDNAELICPNELVEKHAQAAQRLVQRYAHRSSDLSGVNNLV
jgi:hypothetical protein